MTMKSLIKRAAFQRRISWEKLDSGSQLNEFLDRFRSKYLSCDLVRIGGDADGGYLVPNNFDEVKYCFSPGVDYTAKFERELSETYGIKSFMADASVDDTPIKDENFEFIPKFLGSRTYDHFITLSDWVEQCVGDDDAPRILQMDIEGAEYDVLTYESIDLLASFSTIIIEFHGLQKLFNRDFLRMFSAIFEKIFTHFSICHVHPNNCCGIAELDGVGVPRVMEITFIRNDQLARFASKDKVILPHALDRQNAASKPDIVMPDLWWKDQL